MRGILVLPHNECGVLLHTMGPAPLRFAATVQDRMLLVHIMGIPAPLCYAAMTQVIVV